MEKKKGISASVGGGKEIEKKKWAAASQQLSSEEGKRDHSQTGKPFRDWPLRVTTYERELCLSDALLHSCTLRLVACERVISVSPFSVSLSNGLVLAVAFQRVPSGTCPVYSPVASMTKKFGFLSAGQNAFKVQVGGCRINRGLKKSN